MKYTVLLVLSTVGIVLWIQSFVAAADAARRPNIVLIVSDDQTYSDFGFMGNEGVLAPHLDRLASQSARYVNGYVPSSVCRPSLVTLLTGLYPHQNGVYFNHPPPGFAQLTRSPEIDKQRYDELRERAAGQIRDLPTLPRLLAAQGYRCFQTGKYWEGHWRNAGFTEGMTIAEPSGGTFGDKTLPNGDVVAHGNGDHGLTIGRETMQPIEDFIEDCGETPFLVWYAPFLPHLPHNPPRKYIDLYQDRTEVPEYRVPYYATISFFDDTVGELIRFVEERGLADETVFAFVADNGWTPDAERFRNEFGDWDQIKESKRSPFEDGLRTPILLRWDDVIKPATFRQLVSSIDLMPTLLAAAGVDASGVKLPGVNLLRSARGERSLPDDRAVFGEIYPGDAARLNDPSGDIAYRWVRQRNYKLIVPHSHNGKRPWNRYLTEPALYDVVADPRETRNLIDDDQYGQTVNSLRQLLDEWWLPQ